MDNKEEYELLREVAEHNAMFWNSEGVEKIRKMRENTFETSDEQFGEMIEDIFGRPLPDKESKAFDESTKLDPYLNMDLDEVKFTPF
jgi:hypothetical protein